MTSDIAQEAADPTTTTSIVPGDKNAATKEQLLAVIGDGTLEKLMRERARIRKEKDEHSIAELRIVLSQLEKALSIETKRRMQMTKLIEQECSKQILNVTTKLENAIETKSITFQKRLSTLELKVDELSSKMDEQKNIIPASIQKIGKELQEDIFKIKEELKYECNDRNIRYENMVTQINDYEVHTTQQIEKECTIRDSNISDLKNTLYVQENNRKDVDAKFQSLVDTELNIVKEKLAQETTERKMEDDDIVDGLNSYTEKLQSTLALMADKY